MALLFGVGINDADYKVTKTVLQNGKRKLIWTCPYYTKWRSMLQRCYDVNPHMKSLITYKDVTVVEEWHRFSTFRKWMIKQNPPMHYQLDKDIIKPGNKVYGPDTCLFVSKELNLFFNKSERSRGKYPIGVCYVKRGKKHYYANMTINNNTKGLGYYYTAEEAHQIYLQAKKKDLYDRFIKPETNKILKKHLLNCYNNFEEYIK